MTKKEALEALVKATAIGIAQIQLRCPGPMGVAMAFGLVAAAKAQARAIASAPELK